MNHSSPSHADRYLRCGNWNGNPPNDTPHVSSAWRSSAAGGSGTALAARPPGRRARGRRARSAAAPTAPAPTRCCCACPTPRSPPPRPRCAPGPLVGHCSGATGLDVLGAARGVLAASADDGDRPPAPTFAGAGAAVAGTTPRALRARRSGWPLALGHARRSRSPTRTAPPTTPPPRSPRTSWSRSRRPPSGWPRTAGVDRELLVPLVRATVENWAALGAAARPDRARRPRRRGDRRRQREAVAERAPELLALFDALTERHARAGAAARSRRRHEDRAHRRRAAGAPSPSRAAPAGTIGLVPTMGALHDGHLSLIAPRPRGVRRGRRVAVRQPDPVQRAADLDAYPRDEARDAALAAEAGVDFLFAPAVERGLPAPGSPPRSSVSGLTETLEGAHRGRGALRRRRHGGHQAAQHRRARRRLLRPEGRPAGARDPAAGARPRPAGADRGLPDRARARRPGAVQPQRASRPASERGRAGAAPGAAAAQRRGRRRASATPPRRSRAGALAELAAAGVEPEYLELVAPRDACAGRRGSTATCWPWSPPGSGATRLIDNQLLRVPAAERHTDNGRP